MMDFYHRLSDKSLSGGTISAENIRHILTDDAIQLLPLLQAAYRIRYRYFQNRVKIHILNNAQSGNCTEDCRYCAQSQKPGDGAFSYPMKNDAKLIEEAGEAYTSGAYRHCMVFSGRDLGRNRIDRICSVVDRIKTLYPMEICVSAGFVTRQDASRLKAAGVDRYNHNLNTSRNHYASICTTHDYLKRIETLRTVKSCGLDICSGVIIGLGETIDDIIQMVDALRDVGADSIPVNFFIPVEGHRIENYQTLTPVYCLKVLCTFRLAIPRAEIRAAAGREYHLRSLQPLCLYPANSIFAEGYLTTGGDGVNETRQMIEDAGFEVDTHEGAIR